MNKTIQLINERTSIRKFNNEKISTDEIDVIINAAMRAPTAGNMMMYSIIKVQRKDTLEKLSNSCDHQPFIATADTALIFIADMNKWHNYFMINKINEFAKKNRDQYSGPTTADFMLAVNDAMIAAQNAVIAAESLNIGSCYIGDIMENYEYHQELLNLPQYTFPCGMLVFGKYDYKPTPRERFDRKYIVFNEEYKALNDNELKDMFSKNEERFNPDNSPFENFAQAFYNRKIGAEFFKEMNRSIEKAWREWTKKSLT